MAWRRWLPAAAAAATLSLCRCEDDLVDLHAGDGLEALQPRLPDIGSPIGLPGQGPAAEQGAATPRAGGPMEDLLHWAVQHSDPEKLKDVMKKYADSNLTLKDVYGQDVLDAMFTDESAAMRDLIAQVADFRNDAVSDDDLLTSLDRLEEFVEQIDNAGNLHRMGGLAPLLDLGLGGERDSEVRSQALLALGVAVQNNAPVQADLVGLNALARLAAALPACGGGGAGLAAQEDAKFCGKLLYVLSGLLKNEPAIQTEASALGTLNWLFIHGVGHPSLAVAKKAMGLLETVLAQSPDLQFNPPLTADLVEPSAGALLEHLRGTTGGARDVDASEKALRLLSRLLPRLLTLLPDSFQAQLDDAADGAAARCDKHVGDGEVCGALRELARDCDQVLAARHVRDDEL